MVLLCYKKWWLDNSTLVWHPVEIIKIKGETFYVKVLTMNRLTDYVFPSRFWTSKTSIYEFEYNPNDDRDLNVEYLRTVHPYQNEIAIGYYKEHFTNKVSWCNLTKYDVSVIFISFFLIL